MHSRIFQIQPRPVGEYDGITEDDVPEWFLYSIADYVDESNRKDDLDWLKMSLNGMNGIRFTENEMIIEDREAFLADYFAPKLEELKRIAAGMTLEDMIQLTTPYRIKSLVYPMFDFYIYDGDGLHTFDSFLRQIQFYGTETFYFGNTLDYHY